MTKQTKTTAGELCPHLAAAVLWMSKADRSKPSASFTIRVGRTFIRATDEARAL